MDDPREPRPTPPGSARPVVPPPPAPPVATLPAPGQPPASLPRPPGPRSRALDTFWAARLQPLPTSVLVGSAVVGSLGGVALVGHRPGLGAAVVGLFVWVPAVRALVRRRSVVDLALVVLAVALVAVVAVRDAEWVVAVSLLAAVGLATAAATGARSTPALLLSPFAAAVGAVRALPWLRHGLGARVGNRRGQVLVGLRSVAVTALLLLVFGLLFASADPVFASFLPRVEGPLLPGQVAVGLLVAGLTATLAHLALAPPDWSVATVPPGRPTRRAEWLLPVVALDVLVVGFVAVQVGALRGGHAHVLDTVGLTYAEYAREGFGQLVAATALTLVVVAVATRKAPRGGPRDDLVVRAALGVLCLATLGVVASALTRMSLYVDAFGLTRLRLLVVVVEVVLGVVLVLVLVAGLRRSAGWLPRAVVLVTGVAVLGLGIANPDAMIARHNVTADLAEGVDVSYLRGLSADAVPVMADLEEPWRSCLLEGVEVATPGLRDWNLGRARASSALADGPPVDSAAGSACTQLHADVGASRP